MTGLLEELVFIPFNCGKQNISNWYHPPSFIYLFHISPLHFHKKAATNWTWMELHPTNDTTQPAVK